MSSVGCHVYSVVAFCSEPLWIPLCSCLPLFCLRTQGGLSAVGLHSWWVLRRPSLLTQANCSFLLSSADELQLDCLGYSLLRGSCYILLCGDCCSHSPLCHPKRSFIYTNGLVPFCLSMLVIEDQLCSDGREPLEAFRRELAMPSVWTLCSYPKHLCAVVSPARSWSITALPPERMDTGSSEGFEKQVRIAFTPYTTTLTGLLCQRFCLCVGLCISLWRSQVEVSLSGTSSVIRSHGCFLQLPWSASMLLAKRGYLSCRCVYLP